MMRTRRGFNGHDARVAAAESAAHHTLDRYFARAIVLGGKMGNRRKHRLGSTGVNQNRTIAIGSFERASEGHRDPTTIAAAPILGRHGDAHTEPFEKLEMK